MTNIPALRPRPSQQVMIIGLDGATFRLLRPWLDDGSLPTLSRLMREGAHARLQSTTPPFSGPAWSSFLTGLEAANHGLLDWQGPFRSTDGRRLHTGSDIHGARLWTMFNAQSRTAGFINVPITYPPEPVDGFMVSGMLTPSLQGRFTYPPELGPDLLRRFPAYQLDLDWREFNETRDILAWLPKIHEMTQARLDAGLHLLRTHQPDLFVCVFIATDRLQHKVWHMMDRSHPFYRPEFAEREEAALRAYYRQLDDAVGAFAAELSDQGSLIVVSDHGFGPLVTKFFLNNWLAAEGYLDSDLLLGKGLEETIHNLRGKVQLRTRLKKALGRDGAPKTNEARDPHENFNSLIEGLVHTTQSSFDHIDWAASRAYSGTPGEEGVFLNIRGREPYGVVERGAPADALREEIIGKLLQLRDPRTGERVVARAAPGADIYRGRFQDDAPDIFVELTTGYAIFDIIRPQRSLIFERMKPHEDTGFHLPDGVLFAVGAPWKQGVDIGDARLVDVAPMALYAAGLAIPEGLDGGVPLEAVREDYLRAHPVASMPAMTDGVGEETTYSAEETQAIEERLRSLGYIE